MSDLKDASWNFTMDIFNILLKESPNDNVFLSPMSIMAALAMTLAGARGGTEAELKKALHLEGANAKALHDKVGGMMAGVTKSNTTKLANRIFAEQTFQMLPDFKALLTSCYSAELGQVDFVKQAPKAVAAINAWVEANTNGRIKDLLSESAVDADTRLVLVNAIHFKGLWEKPFQRMETRDLTFHVAPDKEIPMPLMTKDDESFPYSFSKELKCHCVRLAFKTDGLALFVIVPEERFGLAAAETKIAARPALLRELVENVTGTDLSVLMVPRFAITSQFDLETQLPKLGIKTLFDRSTCDLSGLTGEPLHVSKVVHKAFLEVTEEGAEAAAATGMQFVNYCMRMDTPSVVADHPFLVVLAAGGSPLFVGRIAHPEAKEAAKN